ncbi:MAG: hypothetical protein ACRDIB_15555, partial [Ardenticatenaceae bacterium]
MRRLWFGDAAAVMGCESGSRTKFTAMNLTQTLSALRACKWIDLTHSFDPSIPHCTSFEPERRTTLYHYDAGIGVRG